MHLQTGRRTWADHILDSLSAQNVEEYRGATNSESYCSSDPLAAFHDGDLDTDYTAAIPNWSFQGGPDCRHVTPRSQAVLASGVQIWLTPVARCLSFAMATAGKRPTTRYTASEIEVNRKDFTLIAGNSIRKSP